MKVDISEAGNLRIRELFCGVLLEASDIKLGICERDGSFEINVIRNEADKPSWWRVDAKTGTIVKEPVNESVNPDDSKAEGGGGK